jgi:hypothetical protein
MMTYIKILSALIKFNLELGGEMRVKFFVFCIAACHVCYVFLANIGTIRTRMLLAIITYM